MRRFKLNNAKTKRYIAGFIALFLALIFVLGMIIPFLIR